jgi:2-keto-4-pentenoate hydratase
MTLGPTAVIEAARLLLNARGDFRQLNGFPPSCLPQDLDDGYLIQKAFAEEWELPVVGYKIGCTAKDQQRMLGIPEPFFGRLFAPFVKESPAELSAGAFHMLGVETELAFRMRRGLKPRKAGYTLDEVTSAVASVHPALEIIDSRLSHWTKRGAPSLIADNSGNAALVVGAPIKGWQELDLARISAKLTFDGEVVGKGRSSKVLGNPLKALTWLANKLSAAGITLLRGDIVSTGTITGVNYAQAGTVAVGSFGKLGEEVQVTFTD